ncbi:MAG: MBL fold metallo-hydrolase [Bryobacteraceae bacterium]
MVLEHRLPQFAATLKVAREVAPGYWRVFQSERKRPIQAAPYTPDPARWPDTGLHAAWLGHSTVLLKVDGFTILTDPVLGARCGVRVGPVVVGMKRLVAPALWRKQLPPIDLILLSHAHFDHLDQATLRGLERPATTVITASTTSDLLRVRRYGAVQELRWDESTRVGPVSVRAFEVRHWGARMRTDIHRGYNGYLIETGRRRIVFGGDTAYTGSFKSLRESKPVDLAIMPIGAYDPWIAVHCNPEQAWRMSRDCGADFVLPVHHQTFKLSREPNDEPIERLLAAAGRDEKAIVLQRIGQTWDTLACVNRML